MARSMRIEWELLENIDHFISGFIVLGHVKTSHTVAASLPVLQALYSWVQHLVSQQNL